MTDEHRLAKIYLHIMRNYIIQKASKYDKHTARYSKCKIASWTPLLQIWTVDKSLQVQGAVRSKPSLSSASSNLPAAWLPLLSKPCDNPTWHQDNKIHQAWRNHAKCYTFFRKKKKVKQPSMMCSVPSIRIPSRGGSHLNMPNKSGTLAWTKHYKTNKTKHPPDARRR
jgi:hypothetical protein